MGFPNPEWEKAQQALTKLQAEKQGSKEGEEKNTGSSYTQSIENAYYGRGPNPMCPMFGRFPPPANYGFGSMYPPPGPFPPRHGGFNPYGPPNIPPPIHDRPPFSKYDQDVGNANGDSQESINRNGIMAHPRFMSKPAPGVSPVRFNLPKRNPIRPSTPMQSHHNNSQSVPKFRPGLRPPRPQVPLFHMPPTTPQPKENLSSSNEVQLLPPGDEGNLKPQEKRQEAAAKEWSPSLKAYVQRCFASVEQQNMDKIEGLLREKITAAFHTETADTIDWSVEPIVQLVSSTGALPVIPSPQLRVGGSKWGNQSNVNVFAFGQGTNRGRQRGSFREQAWSPGVRRPRSRSRSRSSDSRSRSRSRSPYRSTRHSNHRRRNSSR